MKNMKWNKSIALVVSLALLVCVTIGGTLAYLITSDGPLENVFTPSKVTTAVEENFKNGVKSDVSIKNTGDTTAWIRAAVVVTWQKYNAETEQYEVYGQMPVKDADYTITLKTEDSDAWFIGSDGFYYHKQAVEAGNNSKVLITEAKLAENAQVPDGYYLCIEILASGIQSEPDGVVKEAWKCVEVKDTDGVKTLQPVANQG